MKRMLSVIPALALVSAIALALMVQAPDAAAQMPGAPSGTTSMPSTAHAMRHHRKNFRTFLNAHPDIAQELEKEPSKIHDSNFLSQHSDLKEYLDTHPKFAKHVEARPDAFARYMERYSKHHHPRPSAHNSNSGM